MQEKVSTLPQRKKDKVAIVGFTDHRVGAYSLPRDEFDVVGLNELYRYDSPPGVQPWNLDGWHKAKGPDVVAAMFDYWYEIHDRATNLETSEDGRAHIEALKQFKIPVFTNKPWPDVPNACVFPKEAVERALDSTYFTSTPAWMIGLAIAMGYKDIHVYGIDMAQETEWAEQRACCEHWLGVAKGRGIKTYLPVTSDLLKAVGQYGFGATGSEFRAKLVERKAWLHKQDNEQLAQLRKLDEEYEQKKAEIDARYRQLREQMITVRSQTFGAIQDCEFWERSWSVSGDGKLDVPFIDRSKDARTGIATDNRVAVAPAADTKNRVVAAVGEMR